MTMTYHSCSYYGNNQLDSILDTKSHTMFQCTQVDRYILIQCRYLHFGIYMLYVLNEYNQHINMSGDISLHVQSRPPYSTLLLQSQVHVALCSTPPFLQLRTHVTIVWNDPNHYKSSNSFQHIGTCTSCFT